MGAVYDSGDYEASLDSALKAADWKNLLKERDAAGKRDGWSESVWRCMSKSAGSVRQRRCPPAAGSMHR